MTTDRQRRRRGLFLTGVLVLAVVSGFIALPVAAQGQGTATGTDTATAGTTATFNRSRVTENRGDIAAVSLNLTNTTNATVTVGSRSVNYETNVSVNDSNDDGEITLLMNTYTAGRGQNETGVYDTRNDTVTETNRTTGPLDVPLEASDYNLSVAVDGRETDTATLRLTRPTTRGLVTWTAPAASFENTTAVTEVAAALKRGRITTTDTVANGDVLVDQFKVSGVYGALAATNFSRLVETGALEFTVEQTNPETNRPPKRLDVNRSLENGSIRVIPDERNDVLYVDVDTRTATFENGTPTAGDEFTVGLAFSETGRLAKNDRSATANVTVVGTELGFGDLSLAADANQTVTGTTSVAPGSEVTVRLQRNATTSFVKTNTTTVKPNGSFAATFNLSAVAPGTAVSVRADGPLNTTDRTSAVVRPSRANESGGGPASLSFSDQKTTGETVRVENVTLPEGGFVVVHAANVSTAPVKSVLGASSYLENGTSENVTVPLSHPVADGSRVVAMAHTDGNENQVYDFSSSNATEDRPYTANGEPVAATARLTVRNATAMAAGTHTNASGANGAAGGTGAASGADGAGGNATGGGNGNAGSGTATTGNGAGFGPVVALLAVLALVVGLAVEARR